MDTKDLFWIIIAILGWLFGVVQFFVNRRTQKKDKLINRKYEAYSNYMKKIDEIMNSVRDDPSLIYNIYTDFVKVTLSGDSKKINKALIKLNEKLLAYVKRSIEPLMIVKLELNALLLISSKELRIKIDELLTLTTDFNNEMQKCLNNISPNDSDSMVRELQTFSHTDRWARFQTLNNEITQKMREEIGNK